MLLDIEKYKHHVEKLDMSKAQKEELMRTVWGIMESSVDQAFEEEFEQQSRQPVSHNSLQKGCNKIDSNKPTVLIGHFRNTAEHAVGDGEDHD
ncbi:hypothetical protein [Nitrosomonas marina]|uniref:Uncharacterized protein n=1 Tax=Nitrosomonas marina TaxID=917 RepID=A0A1H8H6P1_9PROT|nr:hypothetical protein [Nitrosomonas marina]SEN51886.1 hypothetical protein SAMN05216325_1224 [Nitrosomonas marina]